MAFACQVAGFVGYSMPQNAPVVKLGLDSEKTLKYFAIASVLFGAFFHYKLVTLPEEQTMLSQWSGKTVAYLFLSKPLFVGGMMALWLWLRGKDWKMAALALTVLSFILAGIFIGGRRGFVIEFVLAAASIIYFVKGVKVPTALALSTIPIGIIFVNGIGIYRSEVRSEVKAGELVSVYDLPTQILRGGKAVFEHYDELLIPEEAFELTNAVYYMEFIAERGSYDFGSGLWDLLVHRFIPAQIVGAELKNSLRFGVLDYTIAQADHRALTGTTLTGFTDAFQAFGYFGAVYFLATGIILRKVWNRSVSGCLVSQLAYGSLMREGLEAVTHNSGNIFVGLVVMTIFILIPIRTIRRVFPNSQQKFGTPHQIPGWRPTGS